MSKGNHKKSESCLHRPNDNNACRWSKKNSSLDKMQLAPGATGSTALHVACANGCIKIVDLLLRNGAAVDVRDKYGSTPMDLAVAKHHTDIVKLLQRLRGRRSLDASTTTTIATTRARRPSLPAIVERQQLNIPPLSTMPVPTPSIDIAHQSRNNSRGVPDLASSNGSVEEEEEEEENSSTIGTPPRTTTTDYYGQGVLNHYDDENYLQSLERRAYGYANNNNKVDVHHPLDSAAAAVTDHVYRNSVDSVDSLNAALESVKRPPFPTVEESTVEALGNNSSHFRQRRRSWWKNTRRKSSSDTQSSSRISLKRLSNASHKSIDLVRKPTLDVGFMPLPKKGTVDVQPKITESPPAVTEQIDQQGGDEDLEKNNKELWTTTTPSPLLKNNNVVSRRPSLKAYFSRLWSWSTRKERQSPCNV